MSTRIALALALALALAACTSPSSATPIPAPTATPVFINVTTPIPAPTATLAPTIDVFACDIAGAQVFTASGITTDKSIGHIAYAGITGFYYEIWDNYALSENGLDSIPQKDKWGNSVRGNYAASDLKALPADKEIYLYNKAGLLAHGNDLLKMDVDPYVCHVRQGNVHWAENIVQIYESTHQLPWPVVDTFYIGAGLSREEVEWVYQQPETIRWNGTGFIGSSSSLHGFEVMPGGKLAYREWKSGVNDFAQLGVTLPLNTEIVVKTNYPTLKNPEKIQRFVLIKCVASNNICMTEVEAQQN